MKNLIALLSVIAVGCVKPSADVRYYTFEGIPASCRQLITVNGQSDDIHAWLTQFERTEKGWVLVDVVPATVGKKGLATPEVKKEGDGKTPAGIYRLERAFGYAEKIETGLTYRQATATDLWVDDAESPDYNLWVKAPTKAKSFEEMKRKDDLYEIGAVIEYNTDPVVAGKGSAIFFHVWGGPDSPTAGCVAVEKEKLRSILKWLDKAKSPHMSIVIR